MSCFNILIKDKDGVIEPAMHRAATRNFEAGKVDVYEDEEGRYWRKDSKEIEVIK